MTAKADAMPDQPTAPGQTTGNELPADVMTALYEQVPPWSQMCRLLEREARAHATLQRERQALRETLEAAIRDADMAKALLHEVATDPEAWLDSALAGLRSALARLTQEDPQ